MPRCVSYISRSSFLGDGTQQLSHLAIGASRVLGGGVDELCPPLAVAINFGMTEQIGGLQDRLQRIAQVVCQGSQVLDVLVVYGRLCCLNERVCRFRMDGSRLSRCGLALGRSHTFRARRREV